MRLIADSSSIMSALIKDSSSRKIINSLSLNFITPSYIFTEIENHKDELIQKSGIDEKSFELLITMIKEKIDIIPDDEVANKEEAKQIMDKIDTKDSIFIALALSKENGGIWSDDTHFEKQNKIKVWKTKDLIKFL